MITKKLTLNRRRWLRLGAGLGLSLGLGLTPDLSSLALDQAQPFSLPFAEPFGPERWYVRQWYGNTRWAYRQRRALYSGGQGLHFGVDLFAPCGTTLGAIGDGTVFAVDGPYGAPPHNVVVRHAGGLFSLYGHLQSRSTLRVGQTLRRGDPLGFVGAPTGADCDTHPHVHLEIRQDNMRAALNPLPLIAADWAALTLGLEAEGLQFQVNLDQPGRWQTILDQPPVRFGSALLNDYERSWP